MKLYCFYDRKAADFFNVFTAVNDECAKRNITPIVNDSNPKNNLSHFAADFDLYALGDLDTKSGILTPACDFICSLVDLKEV